MLVYLDTVIIILPLTQLVPGDRGSDMTIEEQPCVWLNRPTGELQALVSASSEKLLEVIVGSEPSSACACPLQGEAAHPHMAGSLFLVSRGTVHVPSKQFIRLPVSRSVGTLRRDADHINRLISVGTLRRDAEHINRLIIYSHREPQRSDLLSFRESVLFCDFPVLQLQD